MSTAHAPPSCAAHVAGRALSPDGGRPDQHNARRPGPLNPLAFALSLSFALALALSFALACAQRPEQPRPPAPADEGSAESGWSGDQRDRLARLHAALAAPPAEQPGGLLVRLAFDAAADLDLFVTDPQQETVYFANTPSRSGGSLVVDRRCIDPEPRVEAVHFPVPPAGRYRVGVDFHRVCEDSGYSRGERRQGLYAVRIDRGGEPLVREGLLTPGYFEVIVLEFDVPGDSPSDGAAGR